MPAADTQAPAPDRLEYRFRWDAGEHRRMYLASRRIVRGRSKAWLVLKIWLAIVGAIFVRSLFLDSFVPSFTTLWPIGFAAIWIAMDRWGVPALTARAYARSHAACLPNDQVLVLEQDGVTASCTTSKASVRWAGIVDVHETPEFFLLYTTPACALQLPKRAVADAPQLRGWLEATAGRLGLPALRVAS